MLLPAIILAILVLQVLMGCIFVEEALSCSNDTISCSLRKLLLAFVCSRPLVKSDAIQYGNTLICCVEISN
jgi:hypothetical protein